jgi:hypothetical protein
MSRRRAALAFLAAAAAIGAAAYASLGNEGREGRPTSSERTELRKSALALAAANGDPTPDRATVAFGPRGGTEAAAAGRPHRDIFVVRMAGNFESSFFGGPRSRSRGATIVYDAKTLQPLNLGFTRFAHDLSPWGSARELVP